MAKYKITAEIMVDDAKSKKDALTALQVMLDDYDDMNTCGADITIHPIKIEKEKHL